MSRKKFITFSKMKEASCDNVFEASKYCSTLAKFAGGNFVTIAKNKRDKYFAYTSPYDVIRFIIGIAFGILLLREVSRTTSEQDENRSIIFEIIISINTRIETVHLPIVMIMSYHFRFIFFKIKKEIKLIDEKVNYFN